MDREIRNMAVLLGGTTWQPYLSTHLVYTLTNRCLQSQLLFSLARKDQ